MSVLWRNSKLTGNCTCRTWDVANVAEISEDGEVKKERRPIGWSKCSLQALIVQLCRINVEHRKAQQRKHCSSHEHKLRLTRGLCIEGEMIDASISNGFCKSLFQFLLLLFIESENGSWSKECEMTRNCVQWTAQRSLHRFAGNAIFSAARITLNATFWLRSRCWRTEWQQQQQEDQPLLCRLWASWPAASFCGSDAKQQLTWSQENEKIGLSAKRTSNSS